jgi:hypothetical protein
MKIINLFFDKAKREGCQIPACFFKMNEAVTVMTAFFVIQKKTGRITRFFDYFPIVFRLMMWSINPYSFALSADIKLSRSVSLSMTSKG